MEREGGREEGADVAEKKEFFEGKLKRGILVGKSRWGPYCTTPVPTWKFSLGEKEKEEGVKVDHNYYCNTINKEEANTTYPSIVSARKLGASLWEEIHQHLHLVKMRKAGVKHRHYRGEMGLELPTHLTDPSHTPPEQPESASSLRRHVAASLMKHHQSIERNVHALRPVSPASYSSSMEVAAYNPPMTPTSSLDVSERRGESSYNLKTSTELLKVLNRIWSLEEQHTMNTSLMRALKIELNHARGKIKELLQEQHNNRQEIEELLKQVAEDNLVMKSKERDRIKAAVKSVKDELEDERKLRKRSESLHRKLARELYDLKFSFAKGLKELERERKARVLLEDLCDEFARGIGEYEQEVRAMKHKSEEHSGRDDQDRLILHISEAWLDERMQMKLAEAQSNVYEKNTIVDKLSSEIETFLQAKRSGSSNNNDTSHSMKDNLRRHSLESVHLNETVDAPQGNGHGEGSVDGDSHCIDLTKNVDHKERDGCPKLQGQESVEVHLEDMRKSYPTKKKLGSRERIKGRTSSNTQGQFEEQMAWAMSCNGSNTQLLDKEQRNVTEKEANPVEKSFSRKSENCEATQEESHERKGKGDGMHGPNSNHVTDKLIRSQSLLSDGERVFPEKDVREGSSSHSAWRGHASPVQQWMSKFTSTDREISESSSKWPWGVKENTLKAKLIEARIEGQHSRHKASKAQGHFLGVMNKFSAETS